MRKFCIALPGGTEVLRGLVLLATGFFWARRAGRKAKVQVARLRRGSGLAGWYRKRPMTDVGKACH